MRVWMDRDLTTPQHDKLMVKLLNLDAWIYLAGKFGLKNLLEEIEKRKKQWEADEEYGWSHNKPLQVEVKTEVPIYHEHRYGNRSIVGYIDIVVGRSIACEIKATELLLGSTIRQIRKYQSYVDYPHWVVVSPIKEWKAPLASQDITWIPSQLVEVQ